MQPEDAGAGGNNKKVKKKKSERPGGENEKVDHEKNENSPQNPTSPTADDGAPQDGGAEGEETAGDGGSCEDKPGAAPQYWDADGFPVHSARHRRVPVAILSRSCVGRERVFDARTGEALAVAWGIERSAPLLRGRKFLVLTDHSSLRFLLAATSGRLARMCCTLCEFQFRVKYRKGSLNQVADALSRWPPPGDCPEEELILLLGTWSGAGEPEPELTGDVIGFVEKNAENGEQPDSAEEQAEQQPSSGEEQDEKTRKETCEFVHERLGAPSAEKFGKFLRGAGLGKLAHLAPEVARESEDRAQFRKPPKNFTSLIPEQDFNAELQADFYTEGQESFLILVEKSTLYVVLVHVKEGEKAAAAIRGLSAYALFFGFPQRLFSDGGAAFVAEETVAFCADHNVEQGTCPQADSHAGTAEACIKVAKALVRSEAMRKMEPAERARAGTEALNALPSSGVSSSAYERVFGSVSQLPDVFGDAGVRAYLEQQQPGENAKTGLERRTEARAEFYKMRCSRRLAAILKTKKKGGKLQDRKQLFLPLENCWYWSERKEKPSDSRWLKGEVVWHSAGQVRVKKPQSARTALFPERWVRARG